MWNLQCLIFPWFFKQTCNRTKVPNYKYKGLVSFMLFWWVFHYIHFQHFDDPKTHFVDIEHFTKQNNTIKQFRCLVVFIVMWWVKCAIPQYPMLISTNVHICNHKEMSDLYFFVDGFIMLIFSVSGHRSIYVN